MIVESATEAKNRFGKIMDAALRQPVVIQRSGRNNVVMLAYEDYEKLVSLADAVWGKKARRAKRQGFIGAEKSAQLLKRLVNADD